MSTEPVAATKGLVGRLKDKVVLITGAAGSVGSAIAEAVVRAGGIAIATDLSGRAGIDHVLDVTSEQDWQRVIAKIDSTAGRLDGLVNNAGIVGRGTIEETEFATWRQVISVNLDGTFLGCKHGLALLKRNGGAIVNISSVAGLIGGHNLAAYNASKGGIRLLTKSVALYGARLNPQVRCNSVHPAFLENVMLETLLQSSPDRERARGRMTATIPLGRLGKPAEVADLLVYLLSDEAMFVTGAEFVIDGGLTAR